MIFALSNFDSLHFIIIQPEHDKSDIIMTSASSDCTEQKAQKLMFRIQLVKLNLRALHLVLFDTR